VLTDLRLATGADWVWWCVRDSEDTYWIPWGDGEHHEKVTGSRYLRTEAGAWHAIARQLVTWRTPDIWGHIDAYSTRVRTLRLDVGPVIYAVIYQGDRDVATIALGRRAGRAPFAASAEAKAATAAHLLTAGVDGGQGYDAE
jgi:hypothetical protein